MNLVVENSFSAKKKSMYVQISEEICNYITQKGLSSGDKIPSERELASMFGVSRNSVREAIRELETRGILLVQAGRGAYLTGNISDRAMLIQLKKKDFFEIFEVKTVLERHIIEKLTPIIAEDTLTELKRLAEQMIIMAENGFFPQELDDEFHQKLLLTYQNQQIVQIVQNLCMTIAEYNESYFNTGFGILNEHGQSVFDTIPLHLQIIEAMFRCDVAAATAAYDGISAIDISVYSRVRE